MYPIPRTIPVLCMVCLAALSGTHVEAEGLGPRLEIGIGGGGSSMRNRPGWAGKRYGSLFGTAAYRLIAGLAVQGGQEFGFGRNPGSEIIPYDSVGTLKIKKSLRSESAWYGLRYEFIVPARIRTWYLSGVWVAGGIVKTDYTVDISTYYYTGDPPPTIPSGQITIAKTDGTYAALGARWRFTTDETSADDAWMGSYGLDAGVRYISYGDCRVSRSAVELPTSTFHAIEVFVVGFMKVRLFD